MTFIKTGTGKLDNTALGSWSRVALKESIGVAEFSASGGVAERGRGILSGYVRGFYRVQRIKTGAGVSSFVASGASATRFTVTVSLTATASGTKKLVKAFDLPDTSPWFTHAVVARQITRGSTGGTLGNFLGSEFTATFDGMNTGENGHAGGSWERRMYEEGNFRLSFPNREGSDGRLHRERFAPLYDGDFHPGDEWFEIYDHTDLVYTGLTRGAEVSLQEVAVGGSDGAWLLRKTREYWAGHWNHAPRDVWEHYLSLWKMVIADDFEDESRFSWSTSNQTTSDGKWVYLRAGAGDPLAEDPPDDSAILLHDNSPTGGDVSHRARIRAHDSYAFPIGVSQATLGTAWRVECQFWRNRFGVVSDDDPTAVDFDGGNSYVRVGMWDIDADDALIIVQMQEAHTYLSHDGGHTLWRSSYPTDGEDTFQVVVEGRDRWAYAFVNQRLIGCIPIPEGTFNCVPYVAMRPGQNTSHQRVRVESLTCRRTIPYLRPSSSQFGDYRLPGAPVGGGLNGTYFNDLGIKAQIAISDTPQPGTPSPNAYALTVFSPWHKLTAKVGTRIDPYINFTAETTDPYGKTRPAYAVNPPAWQNPGSTLTTPDAESSALIPASQIGKWFSVRWAGSVYLPLASQDARFRVTTMQEGFRLWIGKTRFVERLMDTWNNPTGGATTSGYVKSHIGPEADGSYRDGWYPILFEYGQRGTPGASVKLEYDVGNGFQVIPPHALSPQGIYDEHVRMESHWEVLNTLSETFGYQFTCEPRQFESDEFPGVLVPRVRIGRNTEKIIDDINAANYRVKVNGDTVADSVLSDAAGLGSDEIQRVLEALDFGSRVPGSERPSVQDRLFIQSEYESWGEMNWAPSIAARATSLLALRSSAWEEVEAQPFGSFEMLDSFPLTGSLAMFRWEPGDGVRIVLPVIGVEDSEPRQILGVEFPFVPEGRQGPAVSFKQRPRGFKEFMRRLQRQYMTKQRNYQGQITSTTGSLATFGGALTGIDEVSRVPLPHDLSSVLKAEVIVTEKTDDSDWYLWINGHPAVGYPPIQYPGKYDISGYVKRWNNLPIMRVEFRTDPE